MTSLKHRFLRGFVGSVLGAGTGASVAAVCMAADILSGLFRRELGAQDFGLLYLTIVFITAICGVLWGALFGAILGFCDFSRALNVLLGVVFGGVLSWYLSDTFYGCPLGLRIGCFPLMMGACYFGPRFINRFIVTVGQFWNKD